jgi:MFS family permease
MANRWIVLVLVFLTRTSMGFQFQSVASVAPLMIADLRLSYAQLGTLIGLYMLPGAFFALPGGVIGQRFGERRVVVAGLALMVAGGVLTAGAGGFGTAVAGRLLSGVGAVVMNILLAKMVSDWFAGKELSTAMAIMLTSWPVGLGLAAATLGGVAAGTSWRTAVMATPHDAALPRRTRREFRSPARRAAPPRALAQHHRRFCVGLFQREPRRHHRLRSRPVDRARRHPRRRRSRGEPGDLGDDALGAPGRVSDRPAETPHPAHRDR